MSGSLQGLMGAEEGVSPAISVIHSVKHRGFPRADLWDGCDALPHDEPRFAFFLVKKIFVKANSCFIFQAQSVV